MLNVPSEEWKKIRGELEALGISYDMKEHSDQELLLNELKNFEPDFVLCFEKEIGIDWIEALKDCKLFCPDAAFILINSSCSPEVSRSASRMRADHIIWGDMYFRIPAIIGREIELRRVKDELTRYKAGFVPNITDLQSDAEIADAIFEQMPSIVFIKDIKTNQYTYSNPAAEKILGLKKSFICGKTSEQAFGHFKGSYWHNRDIEQSEKSLPYAISDDLMMTIDGGVKVFATKRLLLRDHEGKPDRIVSISEDVTASKKTLYELEKSYDKMDLIFRNLPIGLLIARETDMTAESANPLFARCLSIPLESLIGQSIFDIFPEDFHESLRDCIDESIRKGSAGASFNQYDDDGSPRIFDLLIDYLPVDPSECHFAITLSDVTNEKNAEDQSKNNYERERELHSMKSRFLSMVGHELRTPLTTIMVSADLLKRYSQEMSSEETAKHCERIQSTILTMINMIEKVMTIGKMEANRFEFNPENIDLQAFCRSIIDDLEFSRHAEHRINFDFKGDSIHAIVDETLFGLILNNLLSNALKYSPGSEHVQLEVNCSLGEIVVKVEDHGIGIPAEDLPNLFHTFYRANNVNDITGYGLGLSIVKKSVAAHKGTISVESNVGKGTRFTVVIPTNGLI